MNLPYWLHLFFIYTHTNLKNILKKLQNSESRVQKELLWTKITTMKQKRNPLGTSKGYMAVNGFKVMTDWSLHEGNATDNYDFIRSCQGIQLQSCKEKVKLWIR